MPLQLYVQSVLMNELAVSVVEETAAYFAQRHPSEIGRFRWVIDAKDPRRVTTQERWWRDTLGPLLESRSRGQPFLRVRDASFDYRYFDKSFKLVKAMWHPDQPREVISGYDIKKIIGKELEFVDSRDEILIQAVDVLASFLRRVLTGRITDPSVVTDLGRLQIRRLRDGVYQSVQLLTLSQEGQKETVPIGKMIRLMAISSRTMIRHPTAHR